MVKSTGLFSIKYNSSGGFAQTALQRGSKVELTALQPDQPRDNSLLWRFRYYTDRFQFGIADRHHFGIVIAITSERLIDIIGIRNTGVCSGIAEVVVCIKVRTPTAKPRLSERGLQIYWSRKGCCP